MVTVYRRVGAPATMTEPNDRVSGGDDVDVDGDEDGRLQSG